MKQGLDIQVTFPTGKSALRVPVEKWVIAGTRVNSHSGASCCCTATAVGCSITTADCCPTVAPICPQ